jgi:hypothetical protein
MRGDEADYQAISIVEFEGSINSAGQSQGHYICDVQEQSSKVWFRTNDNCLPVPILLEDVSKNAYVILLKRSVD